MAAIPETLVACFIDLLRSLYIYYQFASQLKKYNADAEFAKLILISIFTFWWINNHYSEHMTCMWIQSKSVKDFTHDF